MNTNLTYVAIGVAAYAIVYLVVLLIRERRTVKDSTWSDLKAFVVAWLRPANVAVTVLAFVAIPLVVQLYQVADAGARDSKTTQQLSSAVTGDLAYLASALVSDTSLREDIGKKKDLFIVDQAAKLAQLQVEIAGNAIESRNVHYSLVKCDYYIDAGQVRVSKVMTLSLSATSPDTQVTFVFGGREAQAFAETNARVCFQPAADSALDESGRIVDGRWTMDRNALAEHLYVYEGHALVRADLGAKYKTLVLKVPVSARLLGAGEFKVALSYTWGGYSEDQPLTVVAITPSLFPGSVDKYSYSVHFSREILYHIFLALETSGWSVAEPDYFGKSRRDKSLVFTFEFNNLLRDVAFVFQQSKDPPDVQ